VDGAVNIDTICRSNHKRRKSKQLFFEKIAKNNFNVCVHISIGMHTHYTVTIKT